MPSDCLHHHSVRRNPVRLRLPCFSPPRPATRHISTSPPPRLTATSSCRLLTTQTWLGRICRRSPTAMTKILDETLPKGMRCEWTDLTYQQILSGNTALLVFPLCVLLVFLVPAAIAPAMAWSSCASRSFRRCAGSPGPRSGPAPYRPATVWRRSGRSGRGACGWWTADGG